MSVLTSVPVRSAGVAHCSILQLVPLGLQSFHCAPLAVLITWSLSPQLSFIHPYSFPYLLFFTHMDCSATAQSCGFWCHFLIIFFFCVRTHNTFFFCQCVFSCNLLPIQYRDPTPNPGSSGDVGMKIICDIDLEEFTAIHAWAAYIHNSKRGG